MNKTDQAKQTNQGTVAPPDQSPPYINPALSGLLTPLADLRPDPRNARRHSKENLRAIRRSMKGFKQQRPVVALRDGTIIAGNGMYLAAVALAWLWLAVIRFDGTEEEARAFGIADNRTGDLSSFDIGALLEASRELDPHLLKLTGFEEEDFAKMLVDAVADGTAPRLTDPDEIPEAETEEEPAVQTGDIWLLGDHRLLIGDSTKLDSVHRLMDGRKAILVATDPPYLVDFDGGNHPHKNGNSSKWAGTDWDDASQGRELYDDFVEAAVSVAALPNAAYYCFHASRKQAMLESVWDDHDILCHQQIVWRKDAGVPNRSWYTWQHEPILFGWVKGQKPPRIQRKRLSTVWSVSSIPAPIRPDHPTPKPVELFCIPMRQHTKPGDICYEPFSGSASQIIAGEMLGRRVFAIEKSPVYVETSIRRWEQFTGKKAVLDGTDQTLDDVREARRGNA